MAGNAGLEVVALVGLAGIHAFAPRLRFLSVVPRSVWLSAAGGISVAYVFVHLLPELAEGQRQISEEVGAGLRRVENHVYLIALAGLALFYAVEWSSRRSRERRRGAGGPDATGPSALWLSLGSFALYNALIGYVVVHRERETTWSLVTFAVAIGVHFLVTDAGLIRHHGRAFDEVGRWVLVAAVVAGFVVGRATAIGDAALAVVIAFLGGGVVLNVLKEEVPTEQKARLVPFLAGAVVYTALLLAA